MARPKGWTPSATHDAFCKVLCCAMNAVRPITRKELIAQSGVPISSLDKIIESLEHHGIFYVTGRLVDPKQIDAEGNAPGTCPLTYGVNTTPGEFKDRPKSPVYR